MNGRFRIAFLRATRYIRVTAVGTVVDTAVLWILVECLFRGYESQYIVAPMISYECAVINNFLLSYFWVWSDNVDGTVGDIISKFVGYNLVTFLVFLLKLGLLALVGSASGWHPVVCNLIALTATGILSFAVQDQTVFRTRAYARGHEAR